MLTVKGGRDIFLWRRNQNEDNCASAAWDACMEELQNYFVDPLGLQQASTESISHVYQILHPGLS